METCKLTDAETTWESDQLTIKVKYLDEFATNLSMPRKGDLGIDLYANEQVYIPKGKAALVSTGISLQLPVGYALLLKDRSSMSKTTHVLAGVIDNSYTGEIKVRMLCHREQEEPGPVWQDVLIHEDPRQGVIIKKGQKIAQALIVPDLTAIFKLQEVEELSDTNRGSDGFGSTGS